MAAVARPAPAAAGGSSIKVALIVFVCLTVASLAGTVIMFTQQSTLQANMEDAQKRADNAAATAGKAQQDLRAVATKLNGEGTDDGDKIRKSIELALQPVLGDAQIKKAGVSADSTLVTVLKELYKQYSTNNDVLAKTMAERDDLNKKFADLTAAAEARAKEFASKTDEFQKQYAALETQGAANQQAWNQQIEDLKKKLEGSSATAGQQLASERQARQKLEQQLSQKDYRFKEMASKLAKFQPTEGAAASVDAADGTIIRSVSGEGIVYINLGKQDRVRPGMPFSVYSASKGISEKEKATIEVANVFDNTAECRVTSGKNTDPIISGDLIANLVYDKSRQFNFVVAGDFDLNFDGNPDDHAGQKVAAMISKWGGNVLPAVDTQVDFVVLGNPPPPPVKVNENDDAGMKVRAAEQADVYKGFMTVEEEARALSIPILTRTQFMHLLGMAVPRNAPAEHQAAM